jgi:broad specificity phosphatase PhoE
VPAVTIVELVRHAAAAARDDWWGRPDRDRPLTDTGMLQARALATTLAAGAPIARLASSPYTRCVQTLEPLSGALGLPIAEEEPLAEAMTLPVHDGGDAWVASAWLAGRALSLINRLVREHEGGRVVLCSHGDVVPAVMAALAGRDGLGMADVRCPKGARFTLTFDGLRCVEASLTGPPDV